MATRSAELEQRLQIKNRILGVLLRDAREVSGHSIVETAGILGVDNGAYQMFEQGESSPTLPQLEVLSYFFNVPIDHFWGADTIAKQRSDDTLRERVPEMLLLRERIIAIQVRQLREAARMSVEDLSARTGIPINQIEAVERGTMSLPLNELELVSQAVNTNVSDLLDTHGTIGNWMRSQDEFEKFQELPADLREFLLRPINRPYLDLAMRLSTMDVDKLRNIAESILDITY